MASKEVVLKKKYRDREVGGLKVHQYPDSDRVVDILSPQRPPKGIFLTGNMVHGTADEWLEVWYHDHGQRYQGWLDGKFVEAKPLPPPPLVPIPDEKFFRSRVEAAVTVGVILLVAALTLWAFL